MADEAVPESSRRAPAHAGSWALDEAVRRSMVANRSRDTKPELHVRSAVHRRGLRFRVSVRPIAELPRTADMVFRPAKVAVFIDGCFWHGCPEHYVEPRTNADYWSAKIARNKGRDSDTDQRLRDAGWTVLRYWEHEPIEEVAEDIISTVNASRNS
ncbi:MAG: very short patch repair endonuclease [bacterium]|nr:very short patch repair endonuclease [bacterium]